MNFITSRIKTIPILTTPQQNTQRLRIRSKWTALKLLQSLILLKTIKSPLDNARRQSFGILRDQRVRQPGVFTNVTGDDGSISCFVGKWPVDSQMMLPLTMYYCIQWRKKFILRCLTINVTYKTSIFFSRFCKTIKSKIMSIMRRDFFSKEIFCRQLDPSDIKPIGAYKRSCNLTRGFVIVLKTF